MGDFISESTSTILLMRQLHAISAQFSSKLQFSARFPKDYVYSQTYLNLVC
jgi:hypothetical protein